MSQSSPVNEDFAAAAKRLGRVGLSMVGYMHAQFVKIPLALQVRSCNRSPVFAIWEEGYFWKNPFLAALRIFQLMLKA